MWSGRRRTKIHATTRPDHLWPEIWSGMSKAAQRKEKQQRAIEKPKLDSARKLGGIYRKSWNFTWKQTCLCKLKTFRYRETCGESNNRKSKHACILEVHESTKKRLERTLPKNDEDHIAGKGLNSLSHYNLVHNFIPMHQAIKIPNAKAAVDKDWEKLEKLPAWKMTKVKSKKEVILDA